MRRTGRVVVALVGIGFTALLFGCTPASNLAVKLERGVLTIAACDDTNASEVGAWSKIDKASEATVVWTASGSTRLSRGDVVRYGLAPTGMTNESEPAAQPTTGRIGVHILGDPSEMRGAFDIDELDDGKWHRADGSVHDDPCG